MTEPKRHDWPRIIGNIEAAGISHYKLATMMRRQIGWVQRVVAGQEPKHYEGEMLLLIEAEYSAKLKAITVPRGTFENEPSESHKDCMSA